MAKSRRELDHELKVRRIDRTAEVLRWLIRYGSYALSAYFVTNAATRFSGQTTVMDFAANIAANMNANEWGAWVVASICGIGWMRQRKVHHDYIEKSAPILKEHEEARDPHRTSSGLTRRGDTNPGDVR